MKFVAFSSIVVTAALSSYAESVFFPRIYIGYI